MLLPKLSNMTSLSVLSGDNEDIHTVNLSLLECGSLVIAPQLWGGVQQDPLLAIRDILQVLTTQHALDTSTSVVLGDLLNSLCDVPVLGSDLDGPHSYLSGVVSSLDNVGLDVLGLGLEVDSLGVGDSVTVELDTEHDLDDISLLQCDLGVGWQGREVRDDVVDRDGSGEGGA